MNPATESNTPVAPCSICISEIDPGCPRTINPCGHTFHVECLASWVATKENAPCPNCRGPLAPASEGRRAPEEDLVEVTAWRELPQGTLLRNVALFLRIDTGRGPRVLTVFERNGRSGLPAGNVEPGDGSLWAAMAREYLEETGDRLPRLVNIRRFAWRGHTAIFAAETHERVNTGPPGPGSDGEITNRYLTRVFDLRVAAAGSRHSPIIMRRCARRSTLAVLDALGL